MADSVFFGKNFKWAQTQLYLRHTSAANDFLSLRALPLCLMESFSSWLSAVELSVSVGYPLLCFSFHSYLSPPSGCVCLNVRLAFSGMIRGAVRNVPLCANPASEVEAISVPFAGKGFTSEKESITASIRVLRATIWTLVS